MTGQKLKVYFVYSTDRHGHRFDVDLKVATVWSYRQGKLTANDDGVLVLFGRRQPPGEFV